MERASSLQGLSRNRGRVDEADIKVKVARSAALGLWKDEAESKVKVARSGDVGLVAAHVQMWHLPGLEKAGVEESAVRSSEWDSIAWPRWPL